MARKGKIEIGAQVNVTAKEDGSLSKIEKRIEDMSEVEIKVKTDQVKKAIKMIEKQQKALGSKASPILGESLAQLQAQLPALEEAKKKFKQMQTEQEKLTSDVNKGTKAIKQETDAVKQLQKVKLSKDKNSGSYIDKSGRFSVEKKDDTSFYEISDNETKKRLSGLKSIESAEKAINTMLEQEVARQEQLTSATQETANAQNQIGDAVEKNTRQIFNMQSAIKRFNKLVNEVVGLDSPLEIGSAETAKWTIKDIVKYVQDYKDTYNEIGHINHDELKTSDPKTWKSHVQKLQRFINYFTPYINTETTTVSDVTGIEEVIKQQEQLTAATNETTKARQADAQVSTRTIKQINTELDQEKQKLQEINAEIERNDKARAQLDEKKKNYSGVVLGSDKPVYDTDKLRQASVALKEFDELLETRNKFQEKYIKLLDIISNYYVGNYAIGNGLFEDADQFVKFNSDMKALQNLFNNGQKTTNKKTNGLFKNVIRELKSEGASVSRLISSGDVLGEQVWAKLNEEEIKLNQNNQRLLEEKEESLSRINTLRQEELDLIKKTGQEDKKNNDQLKFAEPTINSKTKQTSTTGNSQGTKTAAEELTDFINQVQSLVQMNENNFPFMSVYTKLMNEISNGSLKSAEAVQKLNESMEELGNVGYHAGVISKLNKAETNGRFYGSRRDTGYYGTGHYFVDAAHKEEISNSHNYGSLPFTSVDFSAYDNLFKANTNEIAGKLHDFLEHMTRYTQGSDNYSVEELFDQFQVVFGESKLNMEEFTSKLQELTAFMEHSNLDDRSDSVSTQFMKSLGYNGVDTRGTDYADTRYGSVIYELKEESVLQANITDEIKKRGDMLEKIQYAPGEVFDADTDNKIQDQIQKQKELAEYQAKVQQEYENLYDDTQYKQYLAEVDALNGKLQETEQRISECKNVLNNIDSYVENGAKELESLGLVMSEEEKETSKSETINSFNETLEEAISEREQLVQQLEEVNAKLSVEKERADKALDQAIENVNGRSSPELKQTTPSVDQNPDVTENINKITDSTHEATEAMNELNAEEDEVEKFSAKNITKELDRIRNAINSSEAGLDEVASVKGLQGALLELEKRIDGESFNLVSSSIKKISDSAEQATLSFESLDKSIRVSQTWKMTDGNLELGGINESQKYHNKKSLLGDVSKWEEDAKRAGNLTKEIIEEVDKLKESINEAGEPGSLQSLANQFDNIKNKVSEQISNFKTAKELLKSLNTADLGFYNSEGNSDAQRSYAKQMESYKARYNEIRANTTFSDEQEIELEKIQNEHLQKKSALLDQISAKEQQQVTAVENITNAINTQVEAWKSSGEFNRTFSEDLQKEITKIQESVSTLGKDNDVSQIEQSWNSILQKTQSAIDAKQKYLNSGYKDLFNNDTVYSGKTASDQSELNRLGSSYKSGTSAIQEQVQKEEAAAKEAEEKAKQFDANIKSIYNELINTISQINNLDVKIQNTKLQDAGTGLYSNILNNLQDQRSSLVAQIRSINESIGSELGIVPTDGGSNVTAFFEDTRVQATLTSQEIQKFTDVMQQADNIKWDFDAKITSQIQPAIEKIEELKNSIGDGTIGKGSGIASNIMTMEQALNNMLNSLPKSQSDWTSTQLANVKALTQEIINYGNAVDKQKEKEERYFSGKTKVNSDTSMSEFSDLANNSDNLTNKLKTSKEALESFVSSFSNGQAVITGFTTSADGISKINFSVLEQGSNQIRTFTAEMGQLNSNIYMTETSMNKLSAGTSAAEKAINSISGIINRLKEMQEPGTDTYDSYIETLQNKALALQEAIKATEGSNDVGKQTVLKNMATDANNAVKELDKLIQKHKQLSESSIKIGEIQTGGNVYSQIEQSVKQYASTLKGVTVDIGTFDAQNNTLTYTLTYADGKVNTMKASLDGLDGSIRSQTTSVGQLGSFWKQFGSGLGSIGNQIARAVVGISGIHKAISMLRSGVSAVTEIDTAMTELRKVTDETDATYNKFLQTAASMSGEIGTTMKEFTQATSDFARLGYSIEEATDLSKAANIYMNVGDNISNVSEATESIISTMKGFGLEAEDAMSIVDKFNEVGNNFAIDSAGIGEALQRSASALSEAGNTVDESIGLITAANEVVQDPAVVGTAMKTLSLRIRGAKAELEDAGEDIDSMCDSTAELQEKLLALTGGKVDIMLDETTFKSTTQILREMSQVWDDMTDINKAAALELLGGGDSPQCIVICIKQASNCR